MKVRLIMTVKELVEILNCYPSDTPVYTGGDGVYSVPDMPKTMTLVESESYDGIAYEAGKNEKGFEAVVIN